MIFNNGNVNRMDGTRSHALSNFTGTNVPAAPLTGRQQLNTRKADPSSAARGNKYPIPSILEYRTSPRS